MSLVTDDLVEGEKQPVQIQYFRKITDPFTVIYKLVLDLIKKKRKMSTYNWLVLETLGS